MSDMPNNYADLYTKNLCMLIDSEFFNHTDYLCDYAALLTYRQINKLSDCYLEKHHIIPRSFYLFNNKLVNNSSNNIIALTYSEHLLAHFLMYKSVKNEQLKFKCAKTVLFMINATRCSKNDYYKLKDENILDITEKYDLDEINKLRQFWSKKNSELQKEKWQTAACRAKHMQYWTKENRQKTGQRMSKYYETNYPANTKAVICIETGKLFNSIKEAEQYYKIDSHIGLCCKNKNRTCGGYHWAYADDSNRIEELKKFFGTQKKQFKKSVYCIELDLIFSCAEDAAKQLKLNAAHIRECCRGLLKTHGKMHWRYADDR